MHKLGLKLWSSNSFYIKPAMDLYNESIFDYVELYVVPGTEEGYLQEWKKTKFLFILHAPHAGAGFNLSLKECELKNRGLIKEVESFRAALNPTQVIFHPGIHGSIEETIRQIAIFRNEFSNLFDLAVIENKPKMGLNGEICVGASPEEMGKILDETGLGFCLDIGHAICYAAWEKSDWKKIVENFMKLSPQMFHLSDGDIDSRTDRHYHFGKGNFDLSRIVELLPSGAYVTIETEKNSKNDLNDFKSDALFLQNLFQCQGQKLKHYL